MDLISELSSKLGVDPDGAQALVGALLGGAQAQVKERVGEQEAGAMATAIPELDAWKSHATALLKGGEAGESGDLFGAALGALTGGGGGGLAGALGSALGGATGGQAESVAALTGLLGKLNLSPQVLSVIAPLVVQFLSERLPPELLEKVKTFLPLLGGGSPDLGSMLGGLFK